MLIKKFISQTNSIYLCESKLIINYEFFINNKKYRLFNMIYKLFRLKINF